MLQRIIPIILFTLFCSNVYADNDAFRINDIQISAQLNTLKDSQDASLEQGISEAILILLKRIVPRNFHDKVNKIAEGLILKDYIANYILKNERMTSHSYSALLSVEFEKDEISNLLTQRGIIFSDTYYDNFLLLPSFSMAFESLKDIQEWNAVWDNHIPSELGLLKIKIFNKSLGVMPGVMITDTKNITYKNLTFLAKQYKVKDLIALDTEKKNDQLILKIRFLNPEQDYIKTLKFSRFPDEITNKDFYIRVALDVLEIIDSYWKGEKNVFELRYDTLHGY